MSNGWIGVDLDGTLAEYHGWQGHTHIGKPVRAMVERVEQWLREGKDVRIFTARVFVDLLDNFAHEAQRRAYEAHLAINAWCREHIGQTLPVTNIKDYAMIALYDDRAVQVEANTGRLIEDAQSDRLRREMLVRRVDGLFSPYHVDGQTTFPVMGNHGFAMERAGLLYAGSFPEELMVWQPGYRVFHTTPVFGFTFREQATQRIDDAFVQAAIDFKAALEEYRP